MRGSTVGVLLGMTVNAATGAMAQLKYPETRKESISDQYHGVTVPDPYRWLEDLNSAETAAWVKAQNAVTFKYLNEIPLRDKFKKRITELWDYPKVGLPIREAGRLFYLKNAGLQRQAVLYIRSGTTTPPAVLLDPNKLSPDGSISLAAWAPSPDGRYLVYGLSEGGADWQVLRVREIASGRDLEDSVHWVRFSGLSWTKDGKGFFYSRFPEPPRGQQLAAALSNHKLYYHAVGTPQAQDRLVYERPDLPTWFVGGLVTEDGRYLLITLSPGAEPRNRLYVADLGQPSKPNLAAPIRPLVESDDAEYAPIGNLGTTLFMRTDLDAPRRRVVALDLRKPDKSAWRTVVTEAPDALENVQLVGGRLVTQHLRDVQSTLAVVDSAGKELGAIALPDVGTVAGLSGRADLPELFFAFTSPLYPTTIVRYDVSTKTSSRFEAARPPFDASRYQTMQEFATSRDGTRVPLFITARKDLPRDGSHPTLLYAYGGFSVSLTPGYRPDVPAWLEMGGLWVTANLRGGGEYGEAWHQAGMRERKQNVFDDFIAVAEHLVRERYTAPPKLAISGGSNGGLLVGVAMEQRPDLFAAALPAVGVMDMLRYDQFTGGKAWVAEYGSASDGAAFPKLFEYSPLHNLKDDVCYPATLATTADHDDRVVPSHSFKFIAALQATQGCGRPALIRVETQASHGYRPTDKRIAELADEWAFAAHALGIKEAKD